MWLADWARNVWTACNNCDTELGVGVWSRDGRRLLLGRDGALVDHTVDGSAPDRVLLREADRSVVPVAWLGDDRVAYMSSTDLADYDVRLLAPGATTAQVVLPPTLGIQPDVSPDGRWLAYREQKGHDPNHPATFDSANVIVQAFPGPGARLQVSAGGGSSPQWSKDSKTVYFDGVDSTLYAVDISSSGGLSAGTPRAVMRGTPNCYPSRCSDLAEGPRVLGPLGPADQPESVTRMDLVLNWASTLPMSR